MTTAKTFFLFTIVILLSACGGSSGGGHAKQQTKKDTSNVVGAQRGVTTPAPDVEGVTSYLVIEGVGEFPMTVNQEGELEANIPDLSPGAYTLNIVHEKDGITLASSSDEVSIIQDEVLSLYIAPESFNQNFDDDNDGWVNLSELKLGTDPIDPFSEPDPAQPHLNLGSSSAGTSESPTFSMQSKLGDAVGGQSKSTTYQITTGFNTF